MLKAAIIGFGGIAKAHRAGYADLEKRGIAKLVAAFDIDPLAFDRKITINIDSETKPLEEHINFYKDLEELLAKEEIDFFDICVPTYVHAEYAVKLLRLGYHVLSEKPMALTYGDCERMVEAAKESGRQLMIGQCLRFDPSYEFLKEAMEDGRFGKVEAAFFQRVSSRPVWGYQNWFMDPSLSGGCLTDLHIHDVDIVRYLFGEPDAVSCRVNSPETLETVFSTFFCGNTPISAIGDWSHTGVPFSATYRVNFEKATVVKDGALTVYPKDGGEKYEVSLPPVSCYGEEIAYFCRVVEGSGQNEKNPPESAALSLRLVEHLRESVVAGGAPIPFRL